MSGYFSRYFRIFSLVREIDGAIEREEENSLLCVIRRKSVMSSKGFRGGGGGWDLGGEVWEKKDLLWGGEEEIGI